MDFQRATFFLLSNFSTTGTVKQHSDIVKNCAGFSEGSGKVSREEQAVCHKDAPNQGQLASCLTQDHSTPLCPRRLHPTLYHIGAPVLVHSLCLHADPQVHRSDVKGNGRCNKGVLLIPPRINRAMDSASSSRYSM